MRRRLFAPSPPRAALLFALLSLATGWLAWPWWRSSLWPATGAPWLVVLDGYHRLDWALQRQARTAEPLLLITCPTTGQPTTAQRHRSATLLVLRQGFDTATQATVLAGWLQQRQRRGLPLPHRLLLVTDPHHVQRAALAAQIAVGSSGSRVQPLPVPQPKPLPEGAPWPLWRDALRLQLWRATGSTGALLDATHLQHKIESCYGHS